ncbi:hypothetical protein Fmac_025398 [Flemingia macrophylla]|uniref:Uncharacterized protein n=1 Tax=Flemingia macrophylla TaxID=520843 RepID=A0ABD1LS35_9FABA
MACEEGNGNGENHGFVDSVQGRSVNNNGDMLTAPVEHDVQEEPVRETVKRLETNMQIMVESLANLANIVASQSPMARYANHANSSVKWIPMVFNVPKTMVLDDVQSLVAAYIYGVNKDTLQHRKEVLIKAGGEKQIFGDRRTLKTLVPKGLVDQEAVFLEEMLCDKSYYDYDTNKPKISEYMIFEPDNIQQQSPES